MSGTPTRKYSSGGGAGPRPGFHRQGTESPVGYGERVERARRMSGSGQQMLFPTGLGPSRMSPGPQYSDRRTPSRQTQQTPSNQTFRPIPQHLASPGPRGTFSPITVPRPGFAPSPGYPAQQPAPGGYNQNNSPMSPMGRYGSPARNYEWGFGYPGNPNGSLGSQGIPSSVEPTTANIIAQQSQDYVDEDLAAFQAQISHLQGKEVETDDRIVNGVEAEYGEFPHMVMVQLSDRFTCGGSLIAGDWVVTAGHCCDGMTADMLSVVVGSQHLYEEDSDQQTIQVEEMHLHPLYDDFSIENDICLLKLEIEATLGPYVDIIDLPALNQEYEGGTMCTVIGWGSNGNLEMAKELRKVEVPIVSDTECRIKYGQDLIFDSMLCAGYENIPKDSCQGDDGGPLMCGDGLSGIVSWGAGCGGWYPTVHTQTSYYVQWIHDVMVSNCT